MVLLVPGVIAYLVLVFAGPAAVMERASVAQIAAPVAALLTRGHRGRDPRCRRGGHDLGSVASAVVSTLFAATLRPSPTR